MTGARVAGMSVVPAWIKPAQKSPQPAGGDGLRALGSRARRVFRKDTARQASKERTFAEQFIEQENSPVLADDLSAAFPVICDVLAKRSRRALYELNRWFSWTQNPFAFLIT